MSERVCPKCGGSGGVLYKTRVSGTRTYERGWDGHDSDCLSTDDERYRDNKFGECLDCGARVRVPVPEENHHEQ